ncbi:glycine cleavage system aminomethyltransferase GcvT [Pseudonocardia sp. KRD-184]|uniref:Aminomethyltransferase n=1 Tax=Pseudonocardia oceani TaxID=2792013 RepID=A0ABS6UDI9_9PSEU|nr:glycine cleavage system aminomethyltransferase GcvT [Pseudonocardia oceani]MBW0089136.1 glycine cleavage system aminomethyltransferase GcvT [Pseudonocardia oceani]MBW0095974.1 glycine cleavage system aminomethyltransferase GcvT [Pseudonocardia oceani]MBW0108862.1 glycine cleavage system aminomethyltransferase GcvT [Pseudonocardia oceani]MBW0120205.1 glycine cleavage system aminomethyltransferase GcvT [Pseudonocardia oceani]MBW0130249.1 glycine cleavage system aminomethyltransferase GcvT [Ps
MTSIQELVRTPLDAEHERLGATFTDFAGWRMPVRYDSELAEHHSVRRSAGLFDLSHMGEIEYAGPQAADALDHALAGALSKVEVGRAKYSLLCAPDGGVLDDLVVYRLADDRFLVVVNASNAAQDADELIRRAEGFDVAVTDRSAATALIAVQGPRSPDVLRNAEPGVATLLDGLRYYASAQATVAGIDVLLARTGYTGEDGFELYVPNAQAPALWSALLDSGEPFDLRPTGLACRDTLRMEAGMALYGHELTAGTNPFAAGLRRVVALDKQFVGHDALAVLASEETPRVLVGLRGTGRRAGRAGATVLGPDDAVVGVVSSGVLSPTLGMPIALAFVDRALAEPGTELLVDVRGRSQPYAVAALPFYQRA